MPTPDGYRPVFGVPYAEQRSVGPLVFATCPDCGEDVKLGTRKDFESFASTEFADHYLETHGAAAGYLKVDGVWYERAEP